MLPDIQPGNTKILYFFNCLLDGMHTTIPYIGDFSRCRLNVRLTARIQPLLRGHKYRVLSLFGSCLWLPKQNPNLFWRDLGKKAKDIEIFRKLNSIGLTYKLLSQQHNDLWLGYYFFVNWKFGLIYGFRAYLKIKCFH